MKIDFNPKLQEYTAHKESIDQLMVESMYANDLHSSTILRLEKHLADYVGAQDAVVCNTQFNAFILLFKVLGLKSGDEVIISVLSSGIAVQAALFMEAKVVFVDVIEENATLNVEQVEDAITERTKLIIANTIFGYCADMEPINALALQHDLCVIEDAAEGFGSHYHGKKSSQLSKLATTSFFPTMPLHGVGNGAALFIEDETLLKKAREIRSQGKKGDRYITRGIEACMDPIQAAFVDFKLSIFDQEITTRQQLAQKYTTALQKSALSLPKLDTESNYAFYPVRSLNTTALLSQLTQKAVETKIPFAKPLHLHEAFGFMDYVVGDFPVSEALAQELFLLPLHAYLSSEDQEYIIDSLISVIEN